MRARATEAKPTSSPHAILQHLNNRDLSNRASRVTTLSEQRYWYVILVLRKGVIFRCSPNALLLHNPYSVLYWGFPCRSITDAMVGLGRDFCCPYSLSDLTPRWVTVTLPAHGRAISVPFKMLHESAALPAFISFAEK
jgi:hypothetical protein